MCGAAITTTTAAMRAMKPQIAKILLAYQATSSVTVLVAAFLKLGSVMEIMTAVIKTTAMSQMSAVSLVVQY